VKFAVFFRSPAWEINFFLVAFAEAGPPSIISVGASRKPYRHLRAGAINITLLKAETTNVVIEILLLCVYHLYNKV
jgi:hypothetical protein